jgi:hypothetical protein
MNLLLYRILTLVVLVPAILVANPVYAKDMDDETTAVRFWEFANCALSRDKWRVEQMLAAPKNSKVRNETTRNLAIKNKECLTTTGYNLHLTNGIFRSTVAGSYVARYFKHIVVSDFVSVPEIYSEELLNATVEPKSRLDIGLRRFSECVSRKEYPLVVSLLSTKPYSEDETALFNKLGASMNSCIPVEKGTRLAFGRLDLRARLGSVAYELVIAAKLEPTDA